MTRKILLLLLSIVMLSCMAAKAENEERPKYAHFIDTNKVWEYGYGFEDPFIPTYKRTLYRYTIDGTEDHYGRTYHVLWETERTVWVSESIKDPAEVTTESTMRKVALLREEDGRVYMLYQADGPILYKGIDTHEERYIPVYNLDPYYGINFAKPLRLFISDPSDKWGYSLMETTDIKEGDDILLFDFSIDTGATMDIWGFSSFLICAKTEQDYYNVPPFTPGIFRQTVENSFETTNESGEIIKHIESEYVPHPPFNGKYDYNSYAGATGHSTILGPPVILGGYTSTSEVYTYWFNNLYDKEGNVLYAGKNVQPPAHGGVAEIGADTAPRDMRMFDLMGREISNPLPGTVYIQAGRKLIAR